MAIVFGGSMPAGEHDLIQKITSLQNPRVKQAIRLHSSRGRQSQGRFIVFGQREFDRATAAGIEFDEVFVCESMPDVELNSIQRQLQNPETNLFVVHPDVFSKLSYGDRVDKVVGVAQRVDAELDDIVVADASLIVVAQAIEKPGNLGAIVRTADACGVDAVLLADPLTDFFHPNAIRSSTGTVFSMPVASGPTPRIQKWLSENNFQVFTAMLEGADDLFENDLTGQVALVFGNEANGLDVAWNRQEYRAVKLPMNGAADSLNVSVTASVMIYEAVRQRSARA